MKKSEINKYIKSSEIWKIENYFLKHVYKKNDIIISFHKKLCISRLLHRNKYEYIRCGINGRYKFLINIITVLRAKMCMLITQKFGALFFQF